MIELILGWLLGLAGGPISEAVRRGSRRQELLTALMAELRECRRKMAFVSFRLKSHLNELDQEFLIWLLPIEREEAEITTDWRPVRATERLLEAAASGDLSDQRSRERSAQDTALILKAYTLPLLESGLSELILLPVSFRGEILAIRDQIDFFNQDVPYLADLHRRTFDALPSENWQRVNANLDNGYRIQADRAYRIADRIGRFLQKQHAQGTR